MRYVTKWILVCTLAGSLLGCGGGSQPGGNTVPATGVVSLNGAPVADAQVSFAPKAATGTAAFASTDSSGRFTLSTFGEGDGAVPGEYTVAIIKTLTDGKEWTEEEIIKYQSEHKGELPPPPKVKYEVPESYSDPAESGLTATVSEGGPNEFNFDLK